MTKALYRAFPSLLYAVFAFAQTAELYVSPAGKGGSKATLHGAVAESRKLAAGTPRRIVVQGGKYFLSEPLRLGAQDAGLTIEAARGQKPVLYGGRTVKGWKRDGKFWSATLPEVAEGEWDFRMLVVNDRFAKRARLPEKGAFTHLSEFTVRWMGTNGGGWQRKPTEQELTTMRYRPGDLGPWLEVKNAELTVYHMWDESLVTLKSHDAATQTLTFASPAGHPAGAFGVQKYVVWNTLEGMQQPGQWYLDRVAGKVVYWPLAGENMERAEVIAPVVESIIRIEGARDTPAKGITLRGLTLAVTNTPPVAGGFGAGRYDGAVSVNWAEDARLEGLTVYNTGGQGIKAANAARLVLANNEVRDTGACGVIARGPEVEISDNLVYRVGVTYPSAIGIYCSGNKQRIMHNEVHDTPYTAVNFGGTAGVVEGNLIHHAMLELHDGAAFYVIFGRDMVVRGNLVRDIPDTGGYGSSAYYLDELSENCLVEGNVSVNVERPSHNHIGRKNTIRNNVFVTDGSMSLTFPRSTGYTFEKNILSAAGEIVFKMPPDAIASMPNNLIYSRKDSILYETMEAYASKERSPLELRDGSLAGDPMLDERVRGRYIYLTGSAAHKLGIQPVDVSNAGRRTATVK